MTFTSEGAWSRQVLRPDIRDVDGTLAVFSGIYGSRWVDNAVASLEQQSLASVQAVMALNGQDDAALGALGLPRV